MEGELPVRSDRTLPDVVTGRQESLSHLTGLHVSKIGLSDQTIHCQMELEVI